MSARRIALDVLNKTESSGQYSNIALDLCLDRSFINEKALDRKDRALVSIIVLGVIERKLTLDYYIGKLAKRPENIDNVTRNVIRIGLFQLAFLDRVPSYAAVSETVDLAPKRTRGFVNALLREFLRRNCRIEIEGDRDSVEYLSVEYSIPTELCGRYVALYGVERCRKIFEIFNSTPPLTLRINTLKISLEQYERLLRDDGVEYILRGEDSVSVSGRAVSMLPGFDEGYFFVQDLASQYCVKALGVNAGDIFIDTCSCPGSKSFGAAIEMKNCGKIFSFDLHKSKLSLIESGAMRLGINIIEAQVRDGRDPDESLYLQADCVLCDVPCSGFGVVSKKPEIRYKNLDDCAKLPDIQLEILEKSSEYVKPGGTLFYSTCTVLPEENVENVERFLSRHDEFSLCPFELEGIVSENGMLSLTPDVHGCDGFFMAKMKKNK